MKIAVLADIHGNLAALEAVLEDLRSEAPDTVVNLGDCISGPLWPQETGLLLKRLGWPTVRGNHDRIAVGPKVSPQHRTDHFTQTMISSDVIQWLKGLPQVIPLSEEITMFHATPDQDDLYLSETVHDGRSVQSAPSDITGRLNSKTSSPVLLYGHTHIPRLIMLASGQTIFNPGSVGLPAYDDDAPTPHMMETGSPHARYGLLEHTGFSWRFEHKAIAYDWNKAAKQAAENGRPDWAHALATGFCLRP